MEDGTPVSLLYARHFRKPFSKRVWKRVSNELSKTKRNGGAVDRAIWPQAYWALCEAPSTCRIDRRAARERRIVRHHCRHPARTAWRGNQRYNRAAILPERAQGIAVQAPEPTAGAVRAGHQNHFPTTGRETEVGRAANRRGGIHRRTRKMIMKKRLILILNGKGGVGKSFFAVHFVQYLKDRGIAHAAFDSDNENSTLKRFHPEVGFIDPDHLSEIDQMVEALQDHSVVVVDCRAASTRIFLNHFEDTNLVSLLGSLDAGLTIASPVNHELDSIHQIQKLVSGIKGKTDFLVIRNEVHGE